MKLKAHAKINLGLAVIAKRGDGYHEIDALMARVDLHDTLLLEPIPSGIHLEVHGSDVLTGVSNLAYQAAQLYLGAAAETKGVHITLEKRIPVAAGLGGGSSDAAAVLRGLQRMYPSEVDLMAVAKRLGSDVPFFARDSPAARARGRGERLEPVTLPALHLVLINPSIEVSAADAYANLQNFSPRLKLEQLLDRLQNGEEPGYLNALQPGVLKIEPAIREVIVALRKVGLRGVLMSGSGSTCFGLAQSQVDAAQIADTLQNAHPDWWVSATSTL